MTKRDRERLKRIDREFKNAFKVLTNKDKGIVYFGSARTTEDNEYYRLAYELSYYLGTKGYNGISGGGKGIMEATNKGALDAGVKSIGLNIKLPYEQCDNVYTTKEFTFNYFFVRKFFLTLMSRATIVLPGGWGTMDESYEHLTLVQTGKIKPRPIIYYPYSYYSGLKQWWYDLLIAKGSISETDLKNVYFCKTKEEVYKVIKKYGI